MIRVRHCERSEAIHISSPTFPRGRGKEGWRDRFVAALLATTIMAFGASAAAAADAALVAAAPHPNAARLLLDFLLSEEGQKVFQQNDYLPALPSAPAMVAGLRPNDGGFQAVFLRPDAIYRQLPGWQKVTQDLFR